jgi:hypothetical protein
MACGSEPIPNTPDTPDEELIKNLQLPSSLRVYVGEVVGLAGSGFAEGDILVFAASGKELTVALTLTAEGASFVVPQEMKSAIYTLSLSRGGQTYNLGANDTAIKLNITVIDKPIVEYFDMADTVWVRLDDTVAMSGQGFAAGDTLVVQSATDYLLLPLVNITGQGAAFVVPELLRSNLYELLLRRGGVDHEVKVNGYIQSVYIVNLSTVVMPDLPDQQGATVKGVVYCKTVGLLAGVRVSDGVSTTVTDAQGRYYLPSGKYHGYVFLTLPSGYEPLSETVTDRVAPKFWATLTATPDVCERHDFELVKVNNDEHTLMVMADLHVGNRNDNGDMVQFGQFHTNVHGFVAANAGKKIYTIVLGDMSWDNYWYSKSFDIASYKQNMIANGYPTLAFHVPGNHDNDPRLATPPAWGSTSNDYVSEIKYKKALGPTYYSHNIGKVHYLFLDDVIFVNNNATTTVNGDRTYNSGFTAMQLEWLRQDLAAVEDKSAPLFISFHIPSSSLSSTWVVTKAGFTAEFWNCLTGFSNVHVLSGHTHVTRNMEDPAYPHIYEHNIAAVCETWWWTGHESNYARKLCKDGTPAGYEVFTVSNTNLSWYYQGIDDHATKEKQFRAYDMNYVKAFFNSPAVKSVMAKTENIVPPIYIQDEYLNIDNNVVFINVFNYDKSWTIEVKENGVPLTVNRIYVRDPLHMFCYPYTYCKNHSTSTPTADFVTSLSTHIFYVQASSVSATLEMKVTDRFGNVYTETMTRPRLFDELHMTME